MTTPVIPDLPQLNASAEVNPAARVARGHNRRGRVSPDLPTHLRTESLSPFLSCLLGFSRDFRKSFGDALANRTPVKNQHAVDVLLREMPVVDRNNEIDERIHIDGGHELLFEIVLRTWRKWQQLLNASDLKLHHVHRNAGCASQDNQLPNLRDFRRAGLCCGGRSRRGLAACERSTDQDKSGQSCPSSHVSAPLRSRLVHASTLAASSPW